MAEKLKMCQEKPPLFFIHLLRFLAFSDFSAYRRHHAVSTSYFGEGIEVTEVIVAALEAALPPLPDDLPPDVTAEVVRWAWLDDASLRAVTEAFLSRRQQRRFTTLARKEETGRLTAREREAWEQLQQAYLRLSQNKAMAQFLLTQRVQGRTEDG